MPLKPGGGNWPQPYDETNGQYVDKYTAYHLEQQDIQALYLLQTSGVIPWGMTAHFPSKYVHSLQYKKYFVNVYKRYFQPELPKYSKIMYLFKPNFNRDKSSFFLKLGYTTNDIPLLQNFFIQRTRFDLIEYGRMSKTNDLMVTTQLFMPGKYANGKVIALAWKVNKDLTLEFNTIIINGDVHGKSKI